MKLPHKTLGNDGESRQAWENAYESDKSLYNALPAGDLKNEAYKRMMDTLKEIEKLLKSKRGA